jgi:hypothetical protein
MDPHQIERWDPDPHQSSNLDPDPQQSDKLDTDLHPFANDKPKFTEFEPIGALFLKVFTGRIRIRIKMTTESGSGSS